VECLQIYKLRVCVVCFSPLKVPLLHEFVLKCYKLHFECQMCSSNDEALRELDSYGSQPN